MKSRQEIISKIAYYCFYLGVITEVLIVLIDKSSYINPIEGRLFRITFLLFFTKLFLTKYSKKEYFVIALLLGLGAVSYFVTERNEIIRFVTFVAACKEIDMTQCLKRVFYLTLVGCGVIILLSVAGIYGTVSLTQDYGRGMVETRYVLGMGHPNALQCMVWALTVLGLFLYAEKMKWYAYVLLLMINAVFFCFTDSKTSFLVAMVTIAYTFLVFWVKKEVWRKLCAVSGMLITIGSIILSIFAAANAKHVYNYDWSLDRSAFPTFLKKVDTILTGRMRSLTENDRWEGTIRTWSLFSEPANDYYFDMGWVRLFYWYGIIPATIFIFVLLMVMKYYYKEKHYAALMMIMSFALYSIVEAHAISVYLARNYVVFLIGGCWSAALCGTKKNEE